MVIARVNNYEISKIEYQAELQNVLKKMHLSEPNREAKKMAVSQLIDGYLLLSTAQKANIDICPDEIENRFLDYTINYENEEEFKQDLARMKLDEETLRCKIKNELMVKKYLSDNFKPCKTIAPEKLEKIYQENKEAFLTQDMVRASHILVKGTGEESLKKLTEIENSVKSAKDFIKIAQECSDCPSSCHCGDLGFFTKGKMVKEFEEVAFNLGINQISHPVKTQFGYHLIMVTDKKKSKLANFDEVKEALTKRLKKIDSELKLIRELKKMRLEVDITIYDELL